MLVSAQQNAAAAFTTGSSLAGWATISRDFDKRLDRFAKEPAIAREIDYVKRRLANVTTADQLVSDQRLFEFSLLAYDLEGEENSQGLMKRVLGEDLSNSRSAANRMTDPRYARMARDFGFAPGAGAADQKVLDNLVQNYLRAEYEQRNKVKLPAVLTSKLEGEVAAIGLEPKIDSEIDYAKSALGKLTSADAVAADDRLVAFLAKAAGFTRTPSIDEATLARAITDPDARKALGDERWDKFVKPLAHLAEGRALRADRVTGRIDEVVDRWVKASFTLETGRQVGSVISDRLQRDLDAFAKRSDIASATAEFRKRMEGIDSGAALTRDTKAYGFVLRAFDVERYRRSPDIVQRALELGTDKPGSPARQDTKLEALSKSLGFLERDSIASTSDPSFVDGLVAKYVRVQYERAVGANNSDLRTALYAQRKLPTVTSPYQFLADQVLRSYVLTAIGVPSNTGEDVDRLAKRIERSVELGRLDEPAYVEKLTRRYLSRSTSNSSTTTNPALTLLGASSGQSSSSGFGLDLLLQVQSSR